MFDSKELSSCKEQRERVPGIVPSGKSRHNRLPARELPARSDTSRCPQSYNRCKELFKPREMPIAECRVTVQLPNLSAAEEAEERPVSQVMGHARGVLGALLPRAGTSTSSSSSLRSVSTPAMLFCHLSTLKHLSVIISKKRLMQGQYPSLLEDPSTPFAQTRSRQPFKAWGADTGLKRNLLSTRSSSVCTQRVLLWPLQHLEMRCHAS